jgi:ferredoxin
VRSAGNMQVAVAAVGFTSMIFIIIALAAALLLGYGRRPDRSRTVARRGEGRGRGQFFDDEPAEAQLLGDPGRGGRPVQAGGRQVHDGGRQVHDGGRGASTGGLPVYSAGPATGAMPVIYRGERSTSTVPVPGSGRKVPDAPAPGFQAGGKFGRSHHKDMLTVEVNPSKCARFGFCEHEAPTVFYLESDGRFGYQAVVPVDKMEQVISAMDVCPRRAIKVKLPAEQARERVRPETVPEEPRRTIIPIHGERAPDDGGRRAPRPQI